MVGPHEIVDDRARHNWSSGVYDPIHIRAAQKAGCTRLYTFSVKHFRALAPAALQKLIAAPYSASEAPAARRMLESRGECDDD